MPCTHCRSIVMPYRRFAFYVKPTAICESCGRIVRFRGYWWMLSLALVVMGAVMLAIVYEMVTPILMVPVTLFAFAMDYWYWKTTPWDPVPSPGVDAGPPSTAP